MGFIKDIHDEKVNELRDEIDDLQDRLDSALDQRNELEEKIGTAVDAITEAQFKLSQIVSLINEHQDLMPVEETTRQLNAVSREITNLKEKLRGY